MRRATCGLGIAASLAAGCRVCPPKVTHVEPIMPVEEHPVPFEVAPWLAGGGAMRFAAGQRHLRPSFATGVEGTFTLGRPGLLYFVSPSNPGMPSAVPASFGPFTKN